MFGDHLLVAPIYKDELKNEIHLPKGKWRYWFDDSEVVDGPATFEKEFPLNEYPVYIKEGAIIPMEIKRSYTNIGSEEDEGFLTFLVYPNENTESFKVYKEYEPSTSLTYFNEENYLSIYLLDQQRPHILRIHQEQKPSSVELDGTELKADTYYTWNEEQNKLIIRTSTYDSGNYKIYF